MFTVSINLFGVSNFIRNPETPTENMHYSKLLAEKTMSYAGVTNPFQTDLASC